mmetsp:Transcript_70356/g.187400  ORF Transcript_70356/g.187400 Transcript_70356/m.187400 type:complete len:109 (-) Transcript_70356:66-392(-)
MSDRWSPPGSPRIADQGRWKRAMIAVVHDGRVPEAPLLLGTEDARFSRELRHEIQFAKQRQEARDDLCFEVQEFALCPPFPSGCALLTRGGPLFQEATGRALLQGMLA